MKVKIMSMKTSPASEVQELELNGDEMEMRREAHKILGVRIHWALFSIENVWKFYIM